MSNDNSTINSNNQIECHLSTLCMLCDEPVLIRSPIQSPRICSRCKSLWKDLVNIRNNIVEEQPSTSDNSPNIVNLTSSGKLDIKGN